VDISRTTTVSENTTEAIEAGIRPMLSMKQVLALVPFGRTTLYREMDAGRFPKAHEIAPRRIAWFVDDVKAWQTSIKKVA
jgi:prophage regulatory protein